MQTMNAWKLHSRMSAHCTHRTCVIFDSGYRCEACKSVSVLVLLYNIQKAGVVWWWFMRQWAKVMQNLWHVGSLWQTSNCRPCGKNSIFNWKQCMHDGIWKINVGNKPWWGSASGWATAQSGCGLHVRCAALMYIYVSLETMHNKIPIKGDAAERTGRTVSTN